MTPQLWKRARAEVDYDPCRATLDEVAAAPLSRIWAGGTASEYRELHLIPGPLCPSHSLCWLAAL